MIQALCIDDYSDLIEFINCTFQANEDLASFLANNYSIFTEKNPDFRVGIELKKSIVDILSFYKKMSEFKKDHYDQIQAKNFDFSLPLKFHQLAEVAKEVGQQHVLVFRNKTNVLDLAQKLQKEDSKTLEDKIFKEVSLSLLDEAEVLKQIGSALEFYAKKVVVATTPSDKLKNEKIELVFVGESLCLNSNKKLCYSPKSTTNRYKYLKKIIKNKGKPLSAKELNKGDAGKKSKVNRSIVISQEINKLNELIRNKIGIKNDLILSEGGYKLNTEDFEILST